MVEEELSMNGKLVFIGAGSMAEAIISGIIKNNVSNEQIYVTNRDNRERLARLQQLYHVNVSASKQTVVENAEIIILSMKPKDANMALETIKPYVKKDQLIISVLAGISSDYIMQKLGQDIPIIRAMPNTSAAIGYSATALSKGKFADDEHLQKAKQLFQTIGITVVVKEEDLHAITGLSGSGPAYIYYLVEAMEYAAKEAGLKPDVSKQLIIQTLLGAAEMLKVTKESPAILRKKVTSPGGTTQAGLETLEKYKYQEAVIECVKSAKRRSIELGRVFQ
jgi:pyrroline-5-carboxylate reductase